MWTVKIFLLGFIATSTASFIPDNIIRIGNGFNGGQLAPKCFTTIHISFPNSDINRKCGACIIGPTKVLTSGNCVTTADEGKATNVKFTFGSGNPTAGVRGYGITKISLAPGYSYSVRNSTNNLAILTLNKTVTFNPRLQAAVPLYNSTQDAFVDQQLLVCGFGNIDNHDKKPTAIQCTYLNVVPGSECNPAFATTIAAETTTLVTAATAAGDTPAPTTTTTAPIPNGPIICTQNPDDSNACQGDQGSPVFLQVGTNWSLVGIVGTFANARPNAACLDGHNTIITQLGAFDSWISTA